MAFNQLVFRFRSYNTMEAEKISNFSFTKRIEMFFAYRLEIINPGGLPKGLAMESLLLEKFFPNVHKAFKKELVIFTEK
jgi:hypothetical protein